MSHCTITIPSLLLSHKACTAGLATDKLLKDGEHLAKDKLLKDGEHLAKDKLLKDGEHPDKLLKDEEHHSKVLFNTDPNGQPVP